MVSDLEHIYTTIPVDFIAVYHALLEAMSDYGEQSLKDCKAKCTDKNETVLDCYNMFNAAVAARRNENIKLADLLLYYITSKLTQLGYKVVNTSFPFYVGNNNETKVLVTVDENGEATMTEYSTNYLYYLPFNGKYFLLYIPGTMSKGEGIYDVFFPVNGDYCLIVDPTTRTTILPKEYVEDIGYCIDILSAMGFYGSVDSTVTFDNISGVLNLIVYEHAGDQEPIYTYDVQNNQSLINNVLTLYDN